MQRVLACLLLLAIGGFGFTIGCETPNDQKLPCTEDYNCASGEVCHAGFCTDKSKVPATEKTPDAGTPDTSTKPDTATKPDTTTKPDMTTKPDTTTPLTYPPGPYGADVGDVAIPLNLAHCDANGTKSLEQFYKHPKVKVIQITVHTVWCPSCKTQSRGLGGIYSKYKDKGFEVFYIMTENAQAGSGRISGKECTDYTNQYSFGFPALLDSGSQQMRKYFDRNAVPLNLIITTKDMKIRYKKSGALPERMNGIIESYLQ